MRVVKIAQDLFIDEGVAATSVNRIAKEANSTFILNLAESVGIVILIIMLVMGFLSLIHI